MRQKFTQIVSIVKNCYIKFKYYPWNLLCFLNKKMNKYITTLICWIPELVIGQKIRLVEPKCWKKMLHTLYSAIYRCYCLSSCTSREKLLAAASVHAWFPLWVLAFLKTFTQTWINFIIRKKLSCCQIHKLANCSRNATVTLKNLKICFVLSVWSWFFIFFIYFFANRKWKYWFSQECFLFRFV